MPTTRDAAEPACARAAHEEARGEVTLRLDLGVWHTRDVRHPQQRAHNLQDCFLVRALSSTAFALPFFKKGMVVDETLIIISLEWRQRTRRQGQG